MNTVELLIISMFFPLFPSSMVYTLIDRHLGNMWIRTGLMIVWPQAGVALVYSLRPEIPEWLTFWALGTSLLYAFRSLVLNEVGAWAAFVFVSLLSLGWLLPFEHMGAEQAHGVALISTFPLVMLNLLAVFMVNRFGSSYLGLVGGLVHRYPRLSTLLSVTVLAIIATPPFPLFFLLVGLLSQTTLGTALAMLGIWYLWGWAGVRFLQRLILGPEGHALGTGLVGQADFPRAMTGVYLIMMAVLGVVGLMAALQLTGGGV